MMDLQRVLNLIAIGNFAVASSELSSSLEIQPDIEDVSADYHFLKGVIEHQFGKHLNAINSFKRSLCIDSRNAQTYKFLGNVLVEIGAVKEGAHYLLKGLCFFQMSGNEDVFVFGDSHASECFAGIPRCKVFNLNSMTMDRVGRDRLDVVDFRKYGILPNSSVCLMFGFIDVGSRVIRQTENGQRADEILSTLVRNYVSTIKENCHAVGGCRILLTSLIPPTVKRPDKESPEYPTYGSLPERAVLTVEMNNRLREACRENGFHYLDVHKYFTDPYGICLRAYGDGTAHIRQELDEIVEYELQQIVGVYSSSVSS